MIHLTPVKSIVSIELITKKNAKFQAGCLIGIGAIVGIPVLTQSIGALIVMHFIEVIPNGMM